MPTDFEELKRKLLQSDEEFRQLATQHHDLDEHIHNLATRHHLSEPEQVEEVTLKKRKLQLKDQMEIILRRQRRRTSALTRRGTDAAAPSDFDGFQGQPTGRRRCWPFRVPTPSLHENRSRRISVHRGALVPAAATRRRAALRLEHRLRGARRLPHLLLPRSRAAGSAGPGPRRRRRPTAA